LQLFSPQSNECKAARKEKKTLVAKIQTQKHLRNAPSVQISTPFPIAPSLCPMSGKEKEITYSNNMGNGTSKESSKKEERKGLGRDIFLKIDEAVEKYFIDERRNGGEFERRGRRNGRRYREPTPSPREGMSPDAREKIERWLEGCLRAKCDGHMQSGRGEEEDRDRGEDVGGDVNINEDVGLEVDPDEVENGELKGEEEEEERVKSEKGVSGRQLNNIVAFC
jgi:hypothetical protein